MRIIKKYFLLISLLLLPIFLFSNEGIQAVDVKSNTSPDGNDALAVIYNINGDVQDKFNVMAEENLKTIGYKLVDAHKRVNDQYKKKYGSSKLDVLSFMPIVNSETVLPLLNIDPRIAGFAPFNLLISKKLDEKHTTVGHLQPKVMLDILGIDNKEVREKFTASFPVLDTLTKETLGGEKTYLPLKKLPKERMITYAYKFKPVADIEEFMDEFQEKFESIFDEHKYIIAGYHNFMESHKDAPEILKEYDAFWTYSLCHLKFSYNMFDGQGTPQPLAGLFAPCTVYMYIEKGSNTLIMGMYRLQNWIDTLGITDPKRVKLAEELDKEIMALLAQIGMVAIPNVARPLADKKIVAEIDEKSTRETKSAEEKPENTLAVLYELKGEDAGEKYTKIVEEDLKKVGFKISDAHHRVNDQYKKRYGSTALDMLSFLSVSNDKTMLPLLTIDPRIAIAGPFNMLVAKKKDEAVTYAGHITPETFLEIAGITEEKVIEAFSAAFVPLNETLERRFKEDNIEYTKRYLPYKKLPQARMMHFEIPIDLSGDMEDAIDTFQEKFEHAFIDKSYLIAGYHNFMEAGKNAKNVLKAYDAFWTYSICHMSFSYAMFDTKDAKPLAGLFAPCTMYMYIPKGSNKLFAGMLRMQNWTDALGIDDQERVELSQKLDNEIPAIMTSIGFKSSPYIHPSKVHKATIKKGDKETQKEITSTDEKKGDYLKVVSSTGRVTEVVVPVSVQPVEPIKINTFNSNDMTDRSIKISKRTPPNHVPLEERLLEKKKTHNLSVKIGEAVNGRVPAYIRGKFITVDEAKKRLKDAGFTLLSETPLDKKGKIVSMVFTNEALSKMASKKDRGFAASLRLLVNEETQQISITNPVYVAKAFMQKEYDENLVKPILQKIVMNFEKIFNSKDQLKFQLLPKYKFMFGMPTYEDMIVVAEGKDLFEKIKENKNVLFVQELENGAKLVGVKLGKRTRKFIKKIGTDNAALLPYTILIENDQAKILHPKYYIALMYPQLSMTEFMAIATVPGAIEKDCEKIFE